LQRNAIARISDQ